MNKEVRGFVATAGTLILVAIGAVALGNPLLGPGMVLGYLGADTPVGEATYGAWMTLGFLGET